MTSDQSRRYLKKRGCEFEPGKGGQLIVRRNGKMSVLPQHGGRKQLGTGLMREAWLGLTPRQHSTGGKTKAGRHLEAGRPLPSQTAR